MTEAISILSDTGKILTDLHHGISNTRRYFITSGRDQKLKTVADSAPIDRYLFGEKFPEKLKEAEKVGKELTKPTEKFTKKKPSYTQSDGRLQKTRTDHLNWKGPPRRNNSSSGREGHTQRQKRNYQKKY